MASFANLAEYISKSGHRRPPNSLVPCLSHTGRSPLCCRQQDETQSEKKKPCSCHVSDTWKALAERHCGRPSQRHQVEPKLQRLPFLLGFLRFRAGQNAGGIVLAIAAHPCPWHPLHALGQLPKHGNSPWILVNTLNISQKMIHSWSFPCSFMTSRPRTWPFLQTQWPRSKERSGPTGCRPIKRATPLNVKLSAT